MKNSVTYKFLLRLMVQSRRAEAEQDMDSYVIYYKGIISFIRELGASEDLCSNLWNSIINVGKVLFYEETNCTK